MSGTMDEVPGRTAELDVVIVNWNSRDLLRDCVAALAESSNAARLRVIVVDNASTDGSAEALAPGDLDLLVIRNDTNRGFGAACNQGAAAGGAPILLFLNPDTRVRPDTLRLAIDRLGSSPDTAILGVRQTDESGATLRTCARIPDVRSLAGQAVGLDRLGLVVPHFMTEWDHEETRQVGQVMGAFLMIRRPLFERLGGFDERFFVYFEDVDLCRRAAETGGAVVHFADATIWHGTQGTTAQVKDRRLFYFLRSKALYVAKHHGRAAALLLLALDLGVQVPLRVLRALATGARGDAGAVLRAARMLVADLPRLWPNLGRS
jgi:N-acetylglucosaminyl-diphospho-decaprenol L-rhamnosyltransferase